MNLYPVVYFVLTTLFLSVFVSKFYFTKLSAFLFIFLLVLLSTLRPLGTGSDDFAYVRIFESTLSVSKYIATGSITTYQSFIEPSFLIICMVIKEFGLEINAVFFIYTFLSLLLVYKVSRLNNINPILPLFLIFCHGFLFREMNQIRSALAHSIILLLPFYIASNKKISVSIIMALGGFIHISALSAVVMLFVRRVNMKVFLLGLCLAIILRELWGSLFFLKLIPIPIISDKISNYSETFYFREIPLFDITNIKNFVLSVFFIFFLKSKNNAVLNVTIGAFVFGTVFRIFMGDFEIVAGRVASFFTNFEILLIPILAKYLFPSSYFILVLCYGSMLFGLNLLIKNFTYII